MKYTNKQTKELNASFWITQLFIGKIRVKTILNYINIIPVHKNKKNVKKAK